MRLKILVLMVSVAALSGCGNKGAGGGEAPAPAGPALPTHVQPDSFSGRPGSFSGVWRGACVVAAEGRQSSSCTMTVRIVQENGLLDVTTESRFVYMGVAQRSPQKREVFTISGNAITGREGRHGLIGPEVLTLVSAPTATRYTFVKARRGRLNATLESVTPQLRVLVTAELKNAGRTLPRARTSPRN